MSAQLEKQTIGLPGQGPTVSASGDYSPDDSLMRISAGPAALAQLVMYRIMSLYLEIVGLDQQQKVLESKAQYSETKAQADAIVAAGKALGISMIASASLSLVGVAANFGFNALSGKTEMNDTTKAMKENENQLAPLKKIDELNTKVVSIKQMGGGEPVKPTATTEARMAQLENGEYKVTEANKEDTNLALSHLKGRGDGFKQQYKADINRLYQDQNTNAQKMLSIITQRSNGAQQLSTVFTAVGKGVEGGGSIAKANKDALAALNQTAASIAGSLTQEFGSAMSKALDQALQAIRTLLEIHRSNSVQG